MKDLKRFDTTNCIFPGKGTQYTCNEYVTFTLLVCGFYFFLMARWVLNFYSSVVLNSRNCRWYYPDARRAETFLNLVSLLHTFATHCHCSAVSFLTCVIKLLEMCLSFPLRYTRKTEFSYDSESQWQHQPNSKTELAVKITNATEGSCKQGIKCMTSHVWIKIQFHRRSFCVLSNCFMWRWDLWSQNYHRQQWWDK